MKRRISLVTHLIVLHLSCGLMAACDMPKSSVLFEGPHPAVLSATGLFEDIAAKTIAPANRFYQPNFPLWTDGASKKRWIFLPVGKRVDVTNRNNWVFPVGTKIWKEFSFQGKRVETRLVEKVSEGSTLANWAFVTYAWDPEETDASLVSASGKANMAFTGLMKNGDVASPIETGTSHDIPGQFACKRCHDKGGDPVLSFDALQLSDAEGGLSLQTLIDEGTIVHPGYSRVENLGRTPDERAAIGYLHANCGHCHNPAGPARTELHMHYDLAAVEIQALPLVATAVNQLTEGFEVPGRELGVNAKHIEGGAPDFSAIYLRMQVRGGNSQMPPLGTEVVDRVGLESLNRWIMALAVGRAEPGPEKSIDP